MALNTGQIQYLFNATESKTIGFATPTASVNLPTVINTYTDGSGSNKAQKAIPSSFSLTNGASTTIDLSAIAGLFGTVNCSSVKEIVIQNAATTTTDIITVGDDGTVSNPWTAPFTGSSARANINPGGMWIASSPIVGMTVSGGSKNLMIKNTGTNTVSGTIAILAEGT